MKIYSRNFNQCCQLRRRSGDLDRYGKPSYLPSVPVRCRIQPQQQLFVDQAGEQFTSQAVVYLAADADQGDLLQVDSRWLEIKAVMRSPDLRARQVLIKAVL